MRRTHTASPSSSMSFTITSAPTETISKRFAPAYFSERSTEWGEALDYDACAALREMVIANAGYWIEELHCDGLRLDATQCRAFSIRARRTFFPR